MIGVLFVILLVENLISSFISLSNGSLMSDNVKGISALIHWLILIILIVIAVINYSWIYILLMPLCSLISGWIYAYILLNTIFKR